MKKLLLQLFTANMAGTMLSLVVFLINTFRLPLTEYYFYSYLNAALMIAGLVVLYGTDSLALASFDKFPEGRVFYFFRHCKAKMFRAGLLLLLVSLAWYQYRNSNLPATEVYTGYLLSLPFLFSFVLADVFRYIHTGMYPVFIKYTVLVKLACLLPVLLAAYYNRGLLLVTLAANALAAVLPAIILNRKLKTGSTGMGNSRPLYSNYRLFDNFMANSFPLLYINAAFFLYHSSAGQAVLTHKLLLYTARIYLVLAGIMASVITTVTATYLKRLKGWMLRYRFIYGIGIVMAIGLIACWYMAPLDSNYKFIGWNVVELLLATLFFHVFFINTFAGTQQFRMPLFTGVTACFLIITYGTSINLDNLMLERSLFLILLIILSSFLFSVTVRNKNMAHDSN